MSDSSDKKPIAIIGSGFAGTSMLIHTLLKIADDKTLTEPVKLVLVERSPEQLHGGVAYSKGAAYGGHNLNAGAYSVSLFPGGKPPEGMIDFVDYIQMRAVDNPKLLDALTNPPRQMVNDFLQYTLAIAKERAGGKAVVDIALKKATHLDDHKDGTCTIDFDDGSKLEAGATVLSTGFQESIAPKFAQAVANNSRFMDQPYSGKANPFYDEICHDPENANKSVLIVGTGLTAMDIAARLINSGYKGEIVMQSRRALMHKSYEPTSPEEYLEMGHMRGEARPIEQLGFSRERPKFLAAESIGDLQKAIVAEFLDLRTQGFTGPEILMCWERWVPELADRFPHKDLAELFTKNDALITATRVGVTPNTGMTVKHGLESGQIKVINGAVSNIQPGGENGGLLVTTNEGNEQKVSLNQAVFDAKANRPEQQSYDYVFSAMGNTINYAVPPEQIQDKLWSSLMAEGTATPHWLKAGVTVSRDFSLVDKEGNPSPTVSVIGASIAGHMIVTPYPYPHAPEVLGGKLGPNALGAMTISAEVKMLLDAKYEQMTAAYRPGQPATTPVLKQRVPQPVTVSR